jgi:hypothetical protein
MEDLVTDPNSEGSTAEEIVDLMFLLLEMLIPSSGLVQCRGGGEVLTVLLGRDAEDLLTGPHLGGKCRRQQAFP